MKHELFSHVILTEDLPETGLCRGDLAPVVERYQGIPGQEPGYALEVFNAVGDTVSRCLVCGTLKSKRSAVASGFVFGTRALLRNEGVAA